MKNIIITLLLSVIYLTLKAQKIDENGRMIDSKNIAKTIVEPISILKSPTVVKSGSSFNILYNLPDDKNNGTIKLFNPMKDEELKSIVLTNLKGELRINTSEFNTKGLIIGIYSGGTLLGTSKTTFN
jgi:hypothetical protein